MSSPTSKKKDSFEDSMSHLEEVVHRLEEGQLSLDDSLKTFEEGMKILKKCEAYLKQAEKRIQVLSQDTDGTVTLEVVADIEDLSGGENPR